MKMQGFPRGGSNLKRWPFHLFSISSDQMERQFCVYVCAVGQYVGLCVCVIVGVYLFASVCVSV